MIILLGSRMVFWHFSSRFRSSLGRKGHSYSSLCVTVIMEKNAFAFIPEYFFLCDPSPQRSLLRLVQHKPGRTLTFYFRNYSCSQCFEDQILGYQSVGDGAYVIQESQENQIPRTDQEATRTDLVHWTRTRKVESKKQSIWFWK